MIKVSMLATLLAGLAMGSNVAVDAQPQKPAEARDTQIIVEVNRSLDSLTEEGVQNVQKALYSNIKQYVTSNIKFITSYHVLNNAFAISINSNYVDAVKSLPGVKSVTVNKLHIVTQSVRAAEVEDPDPVNDYGGKDNASAETMHLEEGTTNDGEGTVIAILDNEFYFRAKNSDNKGFYHETFTDLDDDVKVRWETRPDVTKTHVYNSTDDDGEYRWKATIDKATLGEEGSLYFNKKIPFYFDYGGDPNYYGADPDEDFDVSSTTDYHGSHVASIASGNSPYYKGIAPKAQLVCMKVFTNFKANKTDLALGFQNASGAYDIPLLNALEDCITLGVDGINMSLGSNLDDFDAESISMKTLTKLHEEGILSAISAGNAGKTSYGFAGGYGNWTSEMVETGILGGYANQTDSMTIASGQPGRTFYASAFKMNGENVSYQDQVVNVRDSEDYEEDEEHRISDLVAGKEDKRLNWVYIPNFGSGSDYAGKNVTGKIAVVNRGSIDFATKVKTAKEKGAIGVVIINNDPTASDFNFRCNFGEYKPPIPVALVLFKDKAKFSENTAENPDFLVVKNEVDVNPKANKISDFSSDGAACNLDLKPEITAPGDNIRGAVPPQSKEDKQLRPYSTYEFLSGTSMSAPNYAGAQSVVLSKKAVELKDDFEAYNEYRKTVDMRLMSTAIPMVDYEDCPEDGHKGNLDDSYRTSPRLQGAGMANIGDAYKTDVYLEGLDLNDNPIGKSKIALRNSSKINSGTVSLSFLAHNESAVDKTYKASFTVMRPAIKQSNEVVSRKYNYRGEVDAYSSIPGISYWAETVDPVTHESSIEERHTVGDVKIGDVFRLSKEIKIPVLGPEGTLVDKVMDMGRYACTEISEKTDPASGEKWLYATYEPLESSDYQSTQDILIKTSAKVDVVAKANGVTKITLPELSLTLEEKQKILDFYSFGTYLEGYITLESENGDNINLSMPWMGYFAGEGQDYESAPVVEPFGFEKDNSTIYPSELVNDLGKSLLGKSYIDMGSAWVTTYVEPGKEFEYRETILKNDQSLSNLAATDPAYHLLGTDADGNYYEDPSNHLYVGNPISSNTMIIQQFVLRSVDDNYYTIKNKETGEVVAKEVLEDMLFGDRYGRFPLYKSHVDENYLGGGYIAHKAYAMIPLYDEFGTPFAAGDYEIEFNYCLAATHNWIKKSYTLHVLSDEPTITQVQNLSKSMRFYYNDSHISSVVVGKKTYNLSEKEKAGQYIELTHAKINEELENNLNRAWDSGRLFIELKNQAYGRTGILVRFAENKKGYVFSQYTVVEHHSFISSNDFEDLGNDVKFYKVTGTNPIEIKVSDGYVRVKRNGDYPPSPTPSPSKGCGGNIVTTSVLLSSIAGALAILIAFASKKRKLGGKE